MSHLLATQRRYMLSQQLSVRECVYMRMCVHTRM